MGIPYVAKGPAASAGQTTRPTYSRVVRIEIDHAFYNDRNAKPWYRVEPTSTTANLLARYGALLKSEPYGFSIAHNSDMKASALIAHQLLSDVPDIKNFLSFKIYPVDPACGNVSDIPIALNPLSEAYYLSNQYGPKPIKAKGPPADRNTDGSADVTLDIHSEKPLPVKIARFPYYVPSGYGAVVFDVRGLVVFIADPPAYDPAAHDNDPKNRIVYIDLSREPEGCYDIETFKDPLVYSPELGDYRTFCDQRRARLKDLFAPAPRIDENRPTLNSGPTTRVLIIDKLPAPFIFIDIILFPLLEKKQNRIYPIRFNQKKEVVITDIRFSVPVRTRKTYWIYYIISTSLADDLADLVVVNAADPERTFEDATPCVLPNGVAAFRIRSKTPIALFARSSEHWQLMGRRLRTMPTQSILVDRLPIPSGDMVIPEKIDGLAAAQIEGPAQPQEEFTGAKKIPRIKIQNQRHIQLTATNEVSPQPDSFERSKRYRICSHMLVYL